MSEKLVVAGVIPARYGSQRLAGKVLATIGGKPLVQHVYESAKRAKLLNELCIATEDQRVLDTCKRFGAQARMTSAQHASGTDRIAEVAAVGSADVYVNIQGDEPMVHPDMIDQLITPFLSDDSVLMTTLMTKIENKKELENPNVVKVITDLRGDALYFSRSVIPFDRDNQASSPTTYFRHLGLYAYRRDFLLGFSSLKPSRLEQTEKLEQLRVLENGYRIRVVETPHRTIAVDTIEDLEKVREIFEKRSMAGTHG